MSETTTKPTASGVKSALILLGYNTEKSLPKYLRHVQVKTTEVTAEEMSWAKYLIYDDDFGGAWNDESQARMHLTF